MSMGGGYSLLVNSLCKNLFKFSSCLLLVSLGVRERTLSQNALDDDDELMLNVLRCQLTY